MGVAKKRKGYGAVRMSVCVCVLVAAARMKGAASLGRWREGGQAYKVIITAPTPQQARREIGRRA